MKRLNNWKELYQGIILEGQMSFDEWLKTKGMQNESVEVS
jgi:hypothetical protein